MFALHVSVKALFQRIHRLFFLSNNPDQSYLIILSEKGTIRFPEYEVTACQVPWSFKCSPSTLHAMP